MRSNNNLKFYLTNDSILGQNFTENVGLAPRSHKKFDTYDENVDATIANVFASCAFRFAHTLLPVSTHSNSSPSFLWI